MRRALRRLWHHLRDEHAHPARLGAAVAVGLFVGTLPLYGLHLGICVALAWFLRLNKATVYLAANISNPVFAPFLVAFGLVIGEWLRFGALQPVDLDAARGFVSQLRLLGGELPDRYLSALLGDAVLGALLALVGGPTTTLLARRWQARRASGDASALHEALEPAPHERA